MPTASEYANMSGAGGTPPPEPHDPTCLTLVASLTGRLEVEEGRYAGQASRFDALAATCNAVATGGLGSCRAEAIALHQEILAAANRARAAYFPLDNAAGTAVSLVDCSAPSADYLAAEAAADLAVRQLEAFLDSLDGVIAALDARVNDLLSRCPVVRFPNPRRQ